MGTFVAGVKHPFERLFLVLPTKGTYKIPSRIPTNPSESFRGFPWFLQTSTGIGCWIQSWPLLPVSLPCHNSLSSSYSLLCSLQFRTSLNKLQTQQQYFFVVTEVSPFYHKSDITGLPAFLRDEFTLWTENSSCVEEIWKTFKDIIFKAIKSYILLKFWVKIPILKTILRK
jgi:hypothetical protein